MVPRGFKRAPNWFPIMAREAQTSLRSMTKIQRGGNVLICAFLARLLQVTITPGHTNHVNWIFFLTLPPTYWLPIRIRDLKMHCFGHAPSLAEVIGFGF